MSESTFCGSSESSNFISKISALTYTHEACTLMRSCTSECRVVYLIRILPPTHIREFMLKFDETLRKGFEKLLGKKLIDKWWQVAQLASKYGGLTMRSGIRTYGAHYITSLAKTATSVRRIVKDYRLLEFAISEVGDWLASDCDSKHTVKDLFLRSLSNTQDAKKAQNPLISSDWNNLSAPQTCELHEHKRILRWMSREETLHIEAHQGQTTNGSQYSRFLT